MSSVSSKSKRSSISNRTVTNARSYQPIPPLKTQLQSLDKCCNNIVSIVNDFKDISSFDNNASNFHDGLVKILNDIIRCFTGLFRRQNPEKEHISEITRSNIEYFGELKSIFDKFRKLQCNIKLSYLDKIDKLEMLVEFWEFVGDNEAYFINEIWHYCSELYVRTMSENDSQDEDDEGNDDDDTPYDEAYNFFRRNLENHYKILNDLQLKFMRGIKEFDLTKDYQEEEEEEEEEEDNEQDFDEEEDTNPKISRKKQRITERKLRQKVLDSIRRSYSLIFPTLKEYWRNAFDWELKKVQDNIKEKENTRDDDQSDYSEEIDYDVKLKENIIYDLFDSRLSQIENFYKMVVQLKKNNPQPKILIKFITEEASLSFDDQISCIREMWEFASEIKPREFSEYEMTHFGFIIVDNLKSEVKYNMTPKSLNRLSDIFEQAENIGDLQTAQQVINIIIAQINDKIETLKKLYENEVHYFQNQPEWKYINKYVQCQKNQSKEIDVLAQNIAQSIKKSEAAAFIHQKLDPDVDIYRNDSNEKDGNENEYPMKKELKDLVQVGPDFYIVISNHIQELNQELDNIYDNLNERMKKVDDAASVRSSQTYNNEDDDPMTNYHNKMQKVMERRAKKKQANDTLSVYAPSSKSVALHTNIKKKKITESEIQVQNIKKEYRIRIELIQEAICRTYEEFFASIRNLIINAVRYTDDELAEEYNKKLEKMFKQYLTHLNVLKKWYIQEMKVDQVEAVEARMAKNQGVSKKIINDCIKESLREKAHQYVNYYIQLNEGYDDEFDKEIDELDRLLFQKMDDIRSTIHIKQLEIIEHQYRIEMKKEKNREPAQVAEAEKRVRTLLASKQYDEARKEKEKCIKLRASLWNDKKKEIKKKYNKIRNERLERQVKDLELLEQSYNKKRILLEKDYNGYQEKSKKYLRAQLHKQVDFHVKLAAKLNLSGNPNKAESQKVINSTSMNLTKSYEAIVNEILADDNINIDL